MKTFELQKLKPGDKVFWNDPDNGACSRHIQITKIKILAGGVVHISDNYGEVLECFKWELNMARDNDRFDNYREIRAKYASTDRYGNEIKKGDLIGYNPQNKKVIAKDAWSKWVYENRSAQAYEDTGFDCSYDY